MKTSKSTLSVARLALRAARDCLPDYAKAKSPKKFTQPQLVACLVIKEFRQLDYRGIHMVLKEWSDLREVLGLTRVPHFTTLCAAAQRLLGKAQADALLDAVLRQCRKAKILGRRSRRVALDSTGLESRHVSAYYTTRCKQQKRHYKHRYPKLSALCDTHSHLILGLAVDRGPKPDAVEAKQTLYDALKHQRVSTLLGDAGYESEGFHSLCRDERGIRRIIPTTERGRPRRDGKPRPVRGRYRKLMKQRFLKKTYGQRWQIETVFSMLKRNLGAALRARTYHRQNREIRLRVLTHNLAILWRILRCSIQSNCDPISSPSGRPEDPLLRSFLPRTLHQSPYRQRRTPLTLVVHTIEL
jgi:transposase